ncbi:MAG: ABC transporter ATP-binding protein [Pseudohongiella sp.]
MQNEKTEPALLIRDLQFSWSRGQPDLLRIPAWQVMAGDRVFLYGPSGSGKSSLLNLISGIASPLAGVVCVAGTDLTQLSARQRDRFRASSIGVIFQQFNLVSYLSVFDNVRLGTVFAQQQAHADERIDDLLDRLGLGKVRNDKAACLSVGQQQRVAIARALVNAPPLVLADEPTSALDPAARDAFMNTLLTCSAASGSTVLVVSHDHALAGYFDKSVDLQHINRALNSANTQDTINVR